MTLNTQPFKKYFAPPLNFSLFLGIKPYREAVLPVGGRPRLFCNRHGDASWVGSEGYGGDCCRQWTGAVQHLVELLGGAIGQGTLGQAGGQALVNAATGNLILQFTDEQLSGLGRDLLQQRTYNTQGALNDADADGWRWDGERRVVLSGTRNSAGSSLTRTTGDGHEGLYSWTGSGYQSSDGDGAHDRLQWDAVNNQWLWTDGSRRTERYAGHRSIPLGFLVFLPR